MHPKCAGMEKIRANDHNIRYIALKVSNFWILISGFCGFGVLVMSGCACACDGWWVVVVGHVGCNLVHVWVSVAKCVCV